MTATTSAMVHSGDRINSIGRIRRLVGLFIAVALSVAAPAAHADPDDVRWSPDFGAPGLTGDPAGGWSAVRAVVDWNGTLVAAGNLTHAGGTPVNNVVAWNGTTFESLGEGLDGTVTSLAVVGSTLYAAGEFTSSGGAPLPNVARWSGSSWEPVGSGPPDDATDLVLHADGATLLLLGRFSAIGDPAVAARCLAAWNGTSWSDVGGFAGAENGYLNAAARVGARLYVGGWFDDEGAPNHLNAWDGASWDYDLAALDGEVRLLSRVGSDLYLYGDFTSADDGNTPVQNLARWDGATIHALTDDVSGVLGMGDDDGRLFVVGAFYNHPGPACAHWDGAAWSAGPDRIWGQFGASLSAFARIGGDLFLAGNIQGFYDYTDGGVIKGGKGVVAWDGARFRALGPGFGVADEGYVYGLQEYGGSLVAAGNFQMIGELGAAQGIAAWDGAQWSRLGDGLHDPLGDPSGDQLATWNGRLVVSGYFTGAGSVASQNIIAWSGTDWEGFNGGFAGQGARIVDFGGQLVAGGLLQTEVGSGSALGHVARWSGAQWQTVGTIAPAAGASALRLEVWSGKVVCAGLFTSIDGVPALNIAQWNGAGWSPLGAGLDGRVTALGIHAGDLYASGDFTASGATPLPGRMARWNGSSWVSVGAGLDYYADTMTSAGGKLFVLGAFGSAGGAPANRLAAWDGVGWSALGSGLGQGVGGNGLGGLDLAPYDGDLFVGGFFNTAGDKSAQKIARWELGAATDVGPHPVDSGLRIATLSHNPAADRISFLIQVPADGHVDAGVFDLRGRMIVRLLSAQLAAGEHRVSWDGRDGSGAPASAGVYWIRVVTPQGQTSRKVVRLR